MLYQNEASAAETLNFKNRILKRRETKKDLDLVSVPADNYERNCTEADQSDQRTVAG